MFITYLNTVLVYISTWTAQHGAGSDQPTSKASELRRPGFFPAIASCLHVVLAEDQGLPQRAAPGPVLMLSNYVPSGCSHLKSFPTEAGFNFSSSFYPQRACLMSPPREEDGEARATRSPGRNIE